MVAGRSALAVVLILLCDNCRLFHVAGHFLDRAQLPFVQLVSPLLDEFYYHFIFVAYLLRVLLTVCNSIILCLTLLSCLLMSLHILICIRALGIHHIINSAENVIESELTCQYLDEHLYEASFHHVLWPNFRVLLQNSTQVTSLWYLCRCCALWRRSGRW